MKRQIRLLETIPNLLLLFLFFACMLATLLAGARIYQRVSSVLDAQYTTTTCANYISAKIRHYDKLEGIAMGKIGDTNALALFDTYDGEKYVTYIYSANGYLMELFCSAEGEFLLQDGEQIMPIDDLKITLNEQIISVVCHYNGKEASSILALHSRGEGMPK